MGKKYALSNCLLRNAGLYVSLSERLWFYTFLSPAVESPHLLIICDVHLSFSLGLLKFEKPAEQGKGKRLGGRAASWREVVTGDGWLSCVLGSDAFVLHNIFWGAPEDAEFCWHWSLHETTAFTTAIEKQYLLMRGRKWGWKVEGINQKYPPLLCCQDKTRAQRASSWLAYLLLKQKIPMQYLLNRNLR